MQGTIWLFSKQHMPVVPVVPVVGKYHAICGTGKTDTLVHPCEYGKAIRGGIRVIHQRDRRWPINPFDSKVPNAAQGRPDGVARSIKTESKNT